MPQDAPLAPKTSQKKVILFMALGLCIPVFLLSMAVLAVNSDAENQQKYAQQRAQMLQKIQAREASEQAKAASQNRHAATDDSTPPVLDQSAAP